MALRRHAFDLLALLVTYHGRILSADEIVGDVWRGFVTAENNLRVQLSALQRALAAMGW